MRIIGRFTSEDKIKTIIEVADTLIIALSTGIMIYHINNEDETFTSTMSFGISSLLDYNPIFMKQRTVDGVKKHYFFIFDHDESQFTITNGKTHAQDKTVSLAPIGINRQEVFALTILNEPAPIIYLAGRKCLWICTFNNSLTVIIPIKTIEHHLPFSEEETILHMSSWNKNYLIITTKANKIYFWDIRNEKLINCVKIDGKITSISVNEDSNTLLVASSIQKAPDQRINSFIQILNVTLKGLSFRSYPIQVKEAGAILRLRFDTKKNLDTIGYVQTASNLPNIQAALRTSAFRSSLYKSSEEDKTVK